MDRSRLPNAIMKYQSAGKREARRHVGDFWIVVETGTGHEARFLEGDNDAGSYRGFI